MKYSELDSIKHFEEQVNNMKLLLNFNKGFNIVDIDKTTLLNLENQIKNLENQLQNLKNIPKQFTETFSIRGWIAYEHLNFELMKNCIETFKSNGIDEAEKLLLENYKPSNLKYEITWTKNIPEMSNRFKLIEYAFNDYENERYYSVVPLLLMVIDGAVNDVLGKGFHSEKGDFDVWDSITNIKDGIYIIKNIFKTGRNKLRNENIDLPYRNGILHGMDLGYDNYNVAAKCWHFLFVVRDWVKAKKSENVRKTKFEEEKKIFSLNEVINTLDETEKIKKALDEWKKRDISNEYLKNINEIQQCDDFSPENIVIKFTEFWKQKNYGYMTNLYCSYIFGDFKPKIPEIRNQFENLLLLDYQIINIQDDAPGITIVDIEAQLENYDSKIYSFRLLYEGSDGFARARNLNDGKWGIVFVQEKKKIISENKNASK
jgi:hypothetical protein